MTPFLGQGVNQSFEDAVELGRLKVFVSTCDSFAAL